MEPFCQPARCKMPCPFSHMLGCPHRYPVVVSGLRPTVRCTFGPDRRRGGLAFPGCVFPRAANRRHIFEPRNLGGEAHQLLTIPELPRTAAPLQAVELVVPGHGVAPILPILIERPDIAHKGCNAGYGCEQQVMRPATFQIERKSTLGDLAAQHSVAL